MPRLTGSEPLTILPLTLELEAAAQAHYKACDRLKLERKQRRMCRRDPGVAETLVEAVSMSALECQYQFRFERWNCSLEGRYRASLLKRGWCGAQGGAGGGAQMAVPQGRPPWGWNSWCSPPPGCCPPCPPDPLLSPHLLPRLTSHRCACGRRHIWVILKGSCHMQGIRAGLQLVPWCPAQSLLPHASLGL